MRSMLLALLVPLLAGCVSVVKVESGENTVGERLILNIDGAWNRIDAPGLGPAQIWTMEGMPVDQLMVYSGLKDGAAIHAERSLGSDTRKSFVFRSGMQANEIVSLFEGMLTRDGSRFTLAKLEPAAFGGGKGLRFEFSLIRKVDGTQLSGVGYAVVDRGELFAIVYIAPRLTFFSRHAARVERIARGARLKV